MFMAALLIIVKTQNPSKCPLTEEWIQKNVKHTHTHTMEYYSALKKK